MLQLSLMSSWSSVKVCLVLGNGFASRHCISLTQWPRKVSWIHVVGGPDELLLFDAAAAACSWPSEGTLPVAPKPAVALAVVPLLRPLLYIILPNEEVLPPVVVFCFSLATISVISFKM